MSVLKTREKKGRSSRKSPRNYTINFRMMIVISEVERVKKERNYVKGESELVEIRGAGGNTMKKHKKFLAFTRALRIQK